MNHRSALRQLAKDYYDGRVDRSRYLEQRHKLIDSLVDNHSENPALQRTTIPQAFHALGEGQLDSTDLSNALANRHEAPSASDGDVTGQTLNDLPPDSSADEAPMPLAPKKAEADRLEMGSEEANTSAASDAEDDPGKTKESLSTGRHWLSIALLAASGLVLIVLALAFL